MDHLSPEARSYLMSRIGRRDTKPERCIGSLLHALGYRFRKQFAALPGRPDFAFPRRRKAVMVHGCFWHQHPGCRHARIPTTRTDFWKAKFARNRERDDRLLRAAEEAGWKVIVIWECETADPTALEKRLAEFLGPRRCG
jgi:DNA mismatch endonuclease Vsr